MNYTVQSEYVPVTSFIHTVKFDNYRRIYEAYQTPADYYLKEYYDAGRLTGDSIYDRHGDSGNPPLPHDSKEPS